MQGWSLCWFGATSAFPTFLALLEVMLTIECLMPVTLDLVYLHRPFHEFGAFALLTYLLVL